jgi:hypothetical protein
MAEDDFINDIPQMTMTLEQANILRMADKLASDPRTRRDMQAMIKKIHPEYPIPEYDMSSMVETRISEFEKKQQEKEEALRKREIEERVARGRGLFKSEGFTEEEIAGIEKRMVDFEVPQDYEKALGWVKKEREFSAPRNMGYEPPTFSMPKFEGLDKDPEKWAREESHRAIDDLIRSRAQ